MTTHSLDKDGVNKILKLLSYKNLKFYQFYNLDFNAEEYQFQHYCHTYTEGDPTLKVLNKTYYDIEILTADDGTFPDADKAAYPINAIAIFNNIKNEATIFTVPYNQETEEELTPAVNQIYLDLCKENPTYIIKDLDIKIRTFKKEEDLLKEFFIHLRGLNSLFLIGFNSSLFDDPYIVNRGLNLCGDEIYKYISEFGEVKKFGERSYEWPDILKVDLLQLYKPVDSGGAGLGKSLPNFKLDTVANTELGLNKIDLEDMNQEYKNNLANFLAYNLLDTLLVFKLDEKLQFLELQWMLAKFNNAPMGAATRGRSIMYRYRNNLIYSEQDKLVRVKPFGREIFYPLVQEEEP